MLSSQMETGNNNSKLHWSIKDLESLHLLGTDVNLHERHAGKSHTHYYSKQHVFKLVESVLPISLLLVRLRPLYQSQWDNYNDAKHVRQYHWNSGRTLYDAVILSELNEGKEMDEKEQYIGEKVVFPACVWDVQTDA